MQYWTDLLRTAVIGHGISIFIFTVVIVIRYAKILMRSPSFYRDRRIPWHILSISASYFLLTIFTCIVLVQKLGEPITWRVPLAMVSFVLGNIGLYLIASYLKDEVDKQRRF